MTKDDDNKGGNPPHGRSGRPEGRSGGRPAGRGGDRPGRDSRPRRDEGDRDDARRAGPRRGAPRDVETEEDTSERIAKRLARKDVRVMVEVPDGGSHAAGMDSAISDQRARILRAEADYDAEIIEARDLKRVRDAAEARIQELEAERLM